MTIQYITANNAVDLIRIQGAAIGSLSKGRNDMQVALVATIQHIFKHGDYMGACQFVKALQTDKANTKHVKPVIDWLEAYGGLVFDKTANTFVDWQKAEYIKQHFAQAKEAMWYDTAKVKAFQGFDADKALDKLVKRFNKMKADLPTLAPEERVQVDLTISQATINALLNMLGLEVILNAPDEDNSDLIEGLEQHLQKQAA